MITNIDPTLKSCITRVGMKDQLCCPICPQPIILNYLTARYCIADCNHHTVICCHPSETDFTILRLDIDKFSINFDFMGEKIVILNRDTAKQILSFPLNTQLLDINEESLRKKINLYVTLS